MRGTAALYIILGVALVLAFLFSLFVGPASVGPLLMLKALAGQDLDAVGTIVREIRLPRALLGLLIGGALGLSGAALQGYLRNPLAEPGTIGVSSAAALGAVIAFYSGFATLVTYALPLGGILGALLSVLLVKILAGRGSSVLGLVLAGVAISSFASALMALSLNLSPNPFAALEIVFWLMGSLANRGMDYVWLSAPFILLGGALLATTGRPLDALTLGDDAAESLGFDLASVRRRLVLGTALSVGAATAVSGVIGFVGLIVPHVIRPFVRQRPSALLPASALGGAILLLFADGLIRLFANGPELKLGVATALVGAPFFLALVLRSRRRWL